MVFDETSLHEAIIETWGEHGAHNDAFTAMRHRLRSIEAENERLREALTTALADLNEEDAHTMTAQTNRLKLGPWQRDPDIRLFAPEPFEQTDRMLSLDRKVWQELGSPDALIVTIEVPS